MGIRVSYAAAGGDDEGICVDRENNPSSAWTQREAQITDAQ